MSTIFEEDFSLENIFKTLSIKVDPAIQVKHAQNKYTHTDTHTHI